MTAPSPAPQTRNRKIMMHSPRAETVEVLDSGGAGTVGVLNSGGAGQWGCWTVEVVGDVGEDYPVRGQAARPPPISELPLSRSLL